MLQVENRYALWRDDVENRYCNYCLSTDQKFRMEIAEARKVAALTKGQQK